MNCAVRQWGGEGVVHEPVLVDQGQSFEAAARHRHLEVVAAARPVDDVKLDCVRKCLFQEGSKRLSHHVAMLAALVCGL